MRSFAARGVNFLRRVKPEPFVLPLVAVRARLGRFRPALWADAKTQMRWMVGDEEPEEVVERLATAYIRRMIWRGEARWHPRLVNRQPVLGLEVLRSLRDAGTAFIVSFAHHGDYEGLGPSLAWAGIPTHTVATEEMFAPRMPVWMRQQKRVVTSNGVQLLNVAHGSAGIKKLLASGNSVSVATDILGNTPVRFLGHDVHITSGAARIARDGNIPVVVVTAHPNPGKPAGCALLKVSEPLYPEQFGSVESLLEVIVRRLEASMLAWPEAAEYPQRRFDPELRIGLRKASEGHGVHKADPTKAAGYSTARPEETDGHD